MKERRLLQVEDIVGAPEITQAQAARNRAEGRRWRRPRPAVRGLLPIGRSSWERGVSAGIFPQPRRIGRRRVWDAEEIEALVAQILAGELLKVSVSHVKHENPGRRSAG